MEPVLCVCLGRSVGLEGQWHYRSKVPMASEYQHSLMEPPWEAFCFLLPYALPKAWAERSSIRMQAGMGVSHGTSEESRPFLQPLTLSGLARCQQAGHPALCLTKKNCLLWKMSHGDPSPRIALGWKRGRSFLSCPGLGLLAQPDLSVERVD